MAFFSDDNKTGATSNVTLSNGSSQRCPEVWIQVKTPYVKGNSPFADLIVGNFTRVDIPVERSTSPIKPDDECVRQSKQVIQQIRYHKIKMKVLRIDLWYKT